MAGEENSCGEFKDVDEILKFLEMEIKLFESLFEELTGKICLPIEILSSLIILRIQVMTLIADPKKDAPFHALSGQEKQNGSVVCGKPSIKPKPVLKTKPAVLPKPKLLPKPKVGTLSIEGKLLKNESPSVK